jgi:transposase
MVMKTPRRDFRSLDESTQAEVRRQAFRNLDNGMKRKTVAIYAEVHYKTIDDWISRRKEFEGREYRGMKRGRSPDEQKILSKAEEKRIKTIIETKTPDKSGLSYALWNRKAIKELIKKKTKKTIVLETVSKYTKRWGLTP